MKRIKRAVFLAFVHGVDAFVARIDRMLATEPDDLVWVPGAMEQGETWQP